MKKTFLSYNHFHRLIQAKAPQIKEQFNPEVIVAIGGGGFIPARILRTFLRVPILAVGLELYNDETNEARLKPKKIQWFDEQSGAIERIKGKRVLVVDEVDDTRTTLQYCIEELKEQDIAEIGVMVVHNKLKEKRGVLPEDIPYFSCEDIDDSWVVYPWEAIDIAEHDSNCID
eukprot:CAMPEP_0174250778 /NCGR_PEP_ID=MMETSP0439-20130205/839_1 /TAXON_ID=0 /ORGANISM="Stereomyxa ramosa, Strain Chinc5" /LENGTH=172 /DNA_ID=CAMNT_0015330933 /DNA_START=60 /DNA_END=578 /DNA_ORIENTATION=+